MNRSVSSLPEKRSEGRFVIGRKHASDLGLRTESGRMYTVHAIRDVSRTGVSLLIGDAMTAGETVSIDYRDHGVRLEIKGNVAWCREASEVDGNSSETPEFVVGLSVRSPLLLKAFLES